MFGKDLEKFRYLSHSFYLIPPRHCSSLEQQKEIAKKLSDKSSILPSGLKFIVIDNISHHLRYKASKIKELTAKSIFLNSFYEEQILPLYFLCSSQNIVLILIHESTFDPQTNLQRPYFFKLYDRMEGISIQMRKDMIIKKKEIILTKAGQKAIIRFEIESSGFVFNGRNR